MTSMTKLLQSIVDETLFMPDKKGKNMLKVTGHQVKQFMNLFTKRGKKWGSLSAAQGREFRENFYSMMRCVIEGRGFALEYEGAKILMMKIQKLQISRRLPTRRILINLKM